jgi:hypothetical protein
MYTVWNGCISEMWHKSLLFVFILYSGQKLNVLQNKARGFDFNLLYMRWVSSGIIYVIQILSTLLKILYATHETSRAKLDLLDIWEDRQSSRLSWRIKNKN